jgi:cytochrome c oxidase subunit 2
MAQSVDGLFYIMLGVITFFFVLVEVLLITFLIRYRRTRTNQVGASIHGNNKLEILWTLVPAAILVVLGAMSVRYVYELQTPPAKPEVIKVTGHMWYWEFQYPNGLKTRNDLRVPAGENVLFQITSGDVIHGFYIPAVRIQQDALPGRLTEFWMNADPGKVGQTFDVPCDQFCGSGHSIMDAKMKIMSPSDYENWKQAELAKQKSGQ